ncbi:MAG: hypothetical protein PHY12_15670, partial [Eubacteriales bacterium]|nr:hypothetical protein [Eubacteriales bacterium]
DAKDVTIYHGETRIYTFTSIPAGESRSLTRDAALSMAGKYQFSARTTDDLGNSVSFDSNEIQIAFSVPTPAPATATPPPVPTAEPTYAVITPVPVTDPSVGAVPKVIRSIVYPIMIAAAVLLAAAVALLLIATKRRVDQKRTSEKAYDHLERAKRRDYVAPNEEETEKPEPAPEAASQTDDAPEEGGDIELPHMKYVRDAYEHQGEYADDAYGTYEDETQPYPDDVMYGTGEEAPYADDTQPQDAQADDGYYADGAQDAEYGADGTYDAAYDQPADGSYGAAYDQPADGSYDAAYDQPADGSYDAAYDQPADGTYDAAYDQPADGTYDASYDQPDDGSYEEGYDQPDAADPEATGAADAPDGADQPTGRRHRRRSAKSSSAE